MVEVVLLYEEFIIGWIYLFFFVLGFVLGYFNYRREVRLLEYFRELLRVIRKE